jgi:preprotein translocase subunit SecE
MFHKLFKFLRDVRAEMNSVSWPSKADLTEGTTVVIVMSAIVSIFLSIVDLTFQYIVGKVFY